MSLAIENLCDVVKGGITDKTDAETVRRFNDRARTIANTLQAPLFIDSGLTEVQVASVIRGSVLTAIKKGVDAALIGAARGYLLPDDPIPRIEQINSRRYLFGEVNLVEPEPTVIIQAAVDLIELGKGYEDGSVTFDRPSPAAQLASFEVSVDGMADQSGDALVDILGYQPDADYIKRKRALDSLSKLDFTKRKTYLLFTSDVMRGGVRQGGTVVCWMRMRDASGYVIAKRDVFGISDFPEIVLSNAALEKSTAALLQENEFIQVLSFYDWVKSGDFYAFVDEDTHLDTLYSYAVAGTQKKLPATQLPFDVPTTALYLSAGQIEQMGQFIREELVRFAKAETDINTVSPYPALSKVIYGDPDFGWMISGCNVLASLRRGDNNETTRSYSYIGSTVTDLLRAVAAGKVVIPTDIGIVNSSVERSIGSYGVSQTVLSVLDGIGATMFISGKDDLSGFQPTQESLERTGTGLAKIIGAIDPQTASISPAALAAALATRSTSTSGPRYLSQIVNITIGQNGATQTKTAQPPSISEVIGNDLIDLTTYSGISRLTNLLRLVYDYYPGGLS